MSEEGLAKQPLCIIQWSDLALSVTPSTKSCSRNQYTNFFIKDSTTKQSSKGQVIVSPGRLHVDLGFRGEVSGCCARAG
jgi:hypothetical protein